MLVNLGGQLAGSCSYVAAGLGSVDNVQRKEEKKRTLCDKLPPGVEAIYSKEPSAV